VVAPDIRGLPNFGVAAVGSGLNDRCGGGRPEKQTGRIGVITMTGDVKATPALPHRSEQRVRLDFEFPW